MEGHFDYADLDEETREKRKKEQVAYRSKKAASTRFMIFASLINILETLVIMLVLFMLAAVLTFKVFHATGPVGQVVFQVLMVVIFIGSMILGFFVYKKTMVFLITKMGLKDKLLDDVLVHYFKEMDDNRKE